MLTNYPKSETRDIPIRKVPAAEQVRFLNNANVIDIRRMATGLTGKTFFHRLRPKKHWDYLQKKLEKHASSLDEL